MNNGLSVISRDTKSNRCKAVSRTDNGAEGSHQVREEKSCRRIS